MPAEIPNVILRSLALNAGLIPSRFAVFHGKMASSACVAITDLTYLADHWRRKCHE
jgi:hypothetical protein